MQNRSSWSNNTAYLVQYYSSAAWRFLISTGCDALCSHSHILNYYFGVFVLKNQIPERPIKPLSTSARHLWLIISTAITVQDTETLRFRVSGIVF
jgi:hypothetical protein